MAREWSRGGRVVWWHFCASFAQIWGARHGLFEPAKSEKVAGWNFAAMHRRRHVACRHVWFKALTTIAATKLISA